MKRTSLSHDVIRSLQNDTVTNDDIMATNDFLFKDDMVSVITLVAYPMVVFIILLVFIRCINVLLALPAVERVKENYRKRRICNKLITKKVKQCKSYNIQDNDSYCPICLDTFKPNDLVSWSKYAKCEHVYHNHCIMLWLMNHVDCPYCRCKFIFTDEGESYLKKIGQERVSSEFCAVHGLISCESNPCGCLESSV